MSLIRPGGLDARAERLASALAAARPRPRIAGLIADNGPDWVLADLAAQKAGVVLVPLPAFFTAEQLAHAVNASGMDSVLGARLPGFDAAGEIEGLAWWRRGALPAALPRGTSKITFTSGTTGRPSARAREMRAGETLAPPTAANLSDLGGDAPRSSAALSAASICGSRITLSASQRSIAARQASGSKLEEPRRPTSASGGTQYSIPAACGA